MRAAASLRLADHAGTVLALGTIGCVAGYMPFGTEIDPWPLMRALQSAGVALTIPLIAGGEVSFRAYDSAQALVPGMFGIHEPHPASTPVQPDLVLVPLLAFDRAGNRLGYGKGYYDRALRQLPAAITVGVGFAVQEVAAVPVGAHDTPLHFILTDNGLIDCHA